MYSVYIEGFPPRTTGLPHFFCLFLVRRILESALAVAQILMDAETVYIVSGELINAHAPSLALEGYKFVLNLLPNLPSAHHQLGLVYSVSWTKGLDILVSCTNTFRLILIVNFTGTQSLR